MSINRRLKRKCGGGHFLPLFFTTGPGGSVVKTLLVNAGDTGLIPDPGRSHMLQSNQAHMPQLPCLYSRAQEPQLPSPQAATTKARVPQSSHSAREKPPPGEARVPQSSHSAREKPPPGEARTPQPDSEPPLTATREKPQTAKTKENIFFKRCGVCTQ